MTPRGIEPLSKPQNSLKNKGFSVFIMITFDYFLITL
nr:MAG TPA: hypothetical protein [Bacteriophage sp.]